MPHPLTSLVGRDADLASVRARVSTDGVRLLTLIGPGGVGKTRLAIRLAEDVAPAYRDGVVFVHLATVADPDLVLPAMARALGLRETGLHPVAELLINHLRDQHLLLILDNFEQVRAAAVQLVPLLSACLDLTMLVTSRSGLRISGEHRHPVSPLTLPDAALPGRDALLAGIAASPAVQLFVVRAQAVVPSFVLDATNAEAVAAICRRLDGLPLAIELAAARVQVLSPAELLARLNPALPLLTGGAKDAPDRLRTMRQAIGWSFALLSPDEQELLRRLAIFPGGSTLAAAETVSRPIGQATDQDLAAPDGAGQLSSSTTLDLLTSLVEASLLRHDETGGETRFTMLETIREFGWEQLEAHGELAMVASSHARWCICWAEEARRSGASSRRDGLIALETEHPNLRAALGWLLAQGEATAALRLAAALAEYWMRHGHLAEGEAWLERALAADDGEMTAARANALVGLNMLHWWRALRANALSELTPGTGEEDGFAHSARLLRQAETVAHAAGDAGALAYTRLHQGYVALLRGDWALAEARGEELLDTAEAIPQRFSRNGALWLLAGAMLQRGEGERAAAYFESLLASARASGDEISQGNALYGLAILAERRGDAGASLAGFVDSAMVCWGYGDRLQAALGLEAAAATAATLRHPEPATRFFAAANSLHIAVIGEAPLRMNLIDRRRHEEALALARAALGDDRFAACWGAGEQLSLDEALAEAQELAVRATAADVDANHAKAAGLAPRERDVMRLLVAGHSDKEIAHTLGIGRRTVSNYVARIRAKLDAPSRTAAVAIAVRDRLV